MAKQKGIKIFNIAESFSGGEGFFTPGRYGVEEARFTMFNFNKEGGEEACCLMLKVQAKDADGKSVGDPLVRYWGLENKGKGDYKPINNGLEVMATGQYPTIWKLSDFAIFMEHLQKAGFDMDTYEESSEITALEGLDAEFGMYVKPDAPGAKVRENADGTPKRPYQIVVVTALVEAKKQGGKGKSAPKGAGKAAPKDEGTDAEQTLTDFLIEHVLVDDNADGIPSMKVRMLIPKKVTDADMARECGRIFSDNQKLGAILSSAGWKLKGDKIMKDEE